MKKPKLYYVCVDFKKGSINTGLNSQLLIYDNKRIAEQWNDHFNIIPIPAEELKALIKKHLNKNIKP